MKAVLIVQYLLPNLFQEFTVPEWHPSFQPAATGPVLAYKEDGIRYGLRPSPPPQFSNADGDRVQQLSQVFNIDTGAELTTQAELIAAGFRTGSLSDAIDEIL